MNRVPVEQHRARLKFLIEKAPEWASDPEGLAHWARYICVLVAGFIEVSIPHWLFEYSRLKCDPRVARYVADRLGRFRNPNMERIAQLLGDFDADWQKRMEEFAEGQRKDSVDSILSNRNQIAHGRNPGITLNRVRTYFECCEEVVDFVEGLVIDATS